MKPIFEKINKLEDQSFYLEEVNKPYFTDLWHFHPEIEILYVREGFGTRYVGDSISSFYPGRSGNYWLKYSACVVIRFRFFKS